jgi:hypothetical protein
MQDVRIEEYYIASAGNDAFYGGRARERCPVWVHVQRRKTMAPGDESEATLFRREILEKHVKLNQ